MGKFSGGLLGIPINTITGNVGGAVGPDAFSNVDLLGSTPITVTGNPAAWTLTITVDSATTTSEGVVELATDAESIAGADTTRAIVPSSLVAKLGTMTANGVAYGAGTAAAVNWTAVGTDGQVLIGATGAAPAFATMASAGGTIVYTPGANTLNLEVGGMFVQSFATDVAGPVVPLAGTITMAGGSNISTDGSVANTVTFNLSGTTDHAVQIGNAGGSLTSVAVGTDGQVLIGATGADPAFATIASAGGTIAFTPGANTLNMETGGTVAISFATDAAGPQSPLAGTITIAGGNNITTDGTTANTVTIDLTGTTQYALQVGDATGSLDSLAIGTANQVLMSGGAGANPAWSTATYPATAATGDVLYGSAANTITALAFDNTATRYLANTGGGATIPAWDQINLTNGVTGILPVANGGTGLNTITDHSLMLGSGAAAVTPLGAATNGQIPIGSTGADPVLATITQGANITVTNGAGSITIASTASGGISWNVITSDLNPMVVDNGYICNKAGLLSVTLPSTSSTGSVLRVTGMNTDAGWKIVQGAGQQIHFGDVSTTSGAGGYLASTLKRDSVELVCVVADTEWNVISSLGNIEIV